MRVLISGYACDPSSGSEPANVWFTALALARAGASVRVLTRDRNTIHDGQWLVADEPNLSLVTLSDAAGSLIPRGPLRYYGPYGAFQRRVALWASEHSDWDVAHHLSWGSLLHPIGLSSRRDKPLLLGPVGGGQRLRPELRKWVDGRTISQLVRNGLVSKAPRLMPWSQTAAKQADCVLTTNVESRALAYRLGSRDVRMELAEGIRSMPTRTNRHAAVDPTIVWLGRFLPIKAAGLAVTSFRRLLHLVPRARLVMIGDGPTRVAVQSSATDLLERGCLRFTGHLPWSVAQSELSQAHVHLFTSVRDSSSAQTLEAAAQGIPTVALGLAGVRDFFRGPGFLQVPPDAVDLPRAIALTLREVLTSTAAEWQWRSEAAVAVAQEHTFERKAKRLLALYEQVS